MQRSRLRLGMALWAIWGVLAVGSIARADQRTDARREFRAGMQSIADGEYDVGIAHLERAYDILPHPNVLYNIGLAQMYAGRSEEALAYFERYKETAPPSDAVEVDTLIRSLTVAAEPQLQSTDVVVADGSNLQSGAALTVPDTILVLEEATNEVRRLAEEQDSELLRRQAAELERALARFRELQGSAEPAQSATAPVEDAPLATPAPPTAVAPQTPPLLPSEEAKQGLYEEEVVSASRFAQSPLDAPNATAIITQQDIRMSGITQLSQLLRRVAGVEVNQMTPNHADISIRGLNRRSSNKVLILWDGKPIRKDFMGTAWWDALPVPLDEVERVEVIRGPASALYGADAFSGVINVITKQPGTGGSYAVLRGGNHGTSQAAMGLSGSSGDLSYRVSGQHYRTNNSVTLVGPDRVDAIPYTDTPENAAMNTTVSGQLDYQIADKTTASAGGYFLYGDTALQGVARIGQVNTDNSYDSMVFANVTTPVGLRVGTWYNQSYADSGQGWLSPDAIQGRGYLTMRQGDIDVSWSGAFKLLVPQSLTIGTNYRYRRLNWTWNAREQSQHHVGVYLQDVMDLTRVLRLQLGARLDRHPLLPTLQFSPRGSLVYRFLESQSLRFSAGRAFRGPTLMESYLHVASDTPLRGVAGWGLGNPNLQPESITSVELGYQNQASDYFALEANLYHNWIKNTILMSDTRRFALQDFQDHPLANYLPDASAYPASVLQFANESAAYRQIGAELGLRFYPVEGLDVYSNYAIHQTKPFDADKVEVARANEQQTSLHKVNTGVQYRTWFGLEASVDLSWFSEQRWIEYVTDLDRGGVRFEEYAQPSFLMLSAAVNQRLLNDRLELGVSGTNLAFERKRQHPWGQPIDTRVLGTVKVRF